MNLPLRFVKSYQVNKPKRQVFQLLMHGVFTLSFFGLVNAPNAQELKFSLPIQCEINQNCFIQNLPDLLQGSDTSDPFCQGASYDGHKGTDIRLLSLKDIDKNIPVIASADGIVKAFRDGEPDKLIITKEDKNNIKNKECGNGVVVSHQDGYESQYCHLKQNSISVQKGQQIKRGDTLGFVGNSGFASFPHVHLSIRKNGQWLDPISGLAPSQTCEPTDLQNTLWDEKTAKYFTENTSRLLMSGIAGKPIEHKQLVKIGPPQGLKNSDQAIVGWAWFINLRKGDQIRFTLEGPKGLISQNTTDAIDRHKASYSGFSGKRTTPEKGEYRLTTQLLRDGNPIEESLFVQTLE